MFYCNRRLSLTFVMIVIVMLMTALPVFAGNGDGSGGGQGEPLRLDSSSPYNGQTGVSLPLLISMTFNKNVVNMTVSDNNLSCFSLYAADGSKVPVEVIMADDQIEPEKKRDVALRPLQELKPGAAYTVKVSSALQAKSGVNMGSDLTITFITAKDNTAPSVNNNPTPQNPGSPPPAGTADPQAAQAGQGGNNTGATDGAVSAGGSPAVSTAGNTAGSGAESAAGESGGQGETVNSEQPGGGQGSGAAAWILAIAALVLIAAGYVISRRKK
ncbi:Ig-like domain-containing protein [Pelotomaculum propionicicum]|uniref:Ig-like domain-containing protein n=1 Tax=Pelotomaculum propionicicum TaxID=258475 RepID=UPI003B7B5DAF